MITLQFHQQTMIGKTAKRKGLKRARIMVSTVLFIRLLGDFFAKYYKLFLFNCICCKRSCFNANSYETSRKSRKNSFIFPQLKIKTGRVKFYYILWGCQLFHKNRYQLCGCTAHVRGQVPMRDLLCFTGWEVLVILGV